MLSLQTKAMKSVSGTLKLDLAQFRELEAFATFGSELDAVSKAQLERGYRLVELLKQPLNSPMPVEEQVVSIFAGTKGYLDDIAVVDVRRFENELLQHCRERHATMLATLRNDPKADVPADLASIVQAFKAGARGLPLVLYGAQLAANLAWSPLFFKAKDLTLAFADIAALLGLAAATAVQCARRWLF
jgi:F0F1-type ATP synthase alpha subunit